MSVSVCGVGSVRDLWGDACVGACVRACVFACMCVCVSACINLRVRRKGVPMCPE